jgi:hypothetical protein
MPHPQQRIHLGKLYTLGHVATEAALDFINAEAVSAMISDYFAIVVSCLEASQPAALECIENDGQIGLNASLPTVKRREEDSSQK